MRILFLITRADTVGGAQVHVRDLSQALQNDGHEVLVITGVPGPYTDNLNRLCISFLTCSTFCRQIRPFQDWKTLGCIRKTIQDFQPDFISAHSSKAGILGRLAAKITDIPCLFTVHGWAFTSGVPQPSRKIYEIVERISESLANKIICVSEYDRTLGIKAGMTPERLIAVHNGMPDIQPEYQADPVGEGVVNLTMIARFDQQKDHTTLLQAMQPIQNLRVNLVGDGPNLDAAKALAEQLEVQNKVSFLGFRSDIPEVLAQSQIFALISHWEGFPRTIIEAMRAGLPVVASQVGGVAEAVIDGETGFCVAKQDVETLRERLTQLVSEPELRLRMGRAGRQRYEENFTFQRMYDQTCQVYRQVLASEGKA